ncbi:MAG: hypothetical protein GF346_07015 [Candidatus Eisenbacteria bacterium]|nr:hypothetical protein [Candidatus Latescibacterota bacterium]MBD3302180.1 hypothetical protein [Candidatus Eisenbacteria bacterium]
MSSRTGSSRALRALLLLLLGGSLGFGGGEPAPAVAQEIDRHLATKHDPAAVELTRYNFLERYQYELEPDSLRYGSREHFEELYPASYWEERFSEVTNDDGSLAWRVSRDAMALITLYDVTGDFELLRRVREYADAAMAERDDHSGNTDEDGRSDPGWSTPRYGEGARRIYLVHSGLILQPILEWAHRAPRDPAWTEADEEHRLRRIEECRETMLYHDYQIAHEAPAGWMVYGTGREEQERKYKWQPFNRQTFFARCFYLLAEMTGEEEYRDRARRLYRFFKDHLQLTRSGAYVWEYEPMRGPEVYPVVSCADVSHATYTIAPVLPACRDGFVFDSEDLPRFARTFTLYIHLGGGVFQTRVGCQPTFSDIYMPRIFAWLPLAESDPEVYRLLRSFLMGNVEKPRPLAIAYLIAYRPKGIHGIDTRAD